jgi:hypothetical protein
MEVTMAVAADDVEIDRSPQGNKINILGVLDEIACGAVPCSVSQITILIGFSADAAEFETQKLVTVQAVDPDGEIRGVSKREYTVPSSPHEAGRVFFHAIFPFAPVHFSQLGPHVFRVWVVEDHVVDVPVYVS